MPEEHVIGIDPSRQLAEEPDTGHNRWHEDLQPALEVDPGDTVIYETRDAFDGQLGPASTADDVANLDLNLVHPLTGPVYVRGAEPGDLLEIHVQEIEADPWEQWGYTVEVPGFGFLRDEFEEPFIVHWPLRGNEYAESDELPGVRIRCNPHLASVGLAPSEDLRRAATERESELAERGGFSLPPEPEGAAPTGALAEEAIRTIPPREVGGNLDIKQLSPGATVLIPVYHEGGMVSVGDIHYAQGDCEACGTAIEMRSRTHLSFRIRKGEAREKGIKDLQFFRYDYFTVPELAAPRRFFATTGISVTRDGKNESEDISLAARNALLNMIDHLQQDRGFTRQQAYALCSVAVDLCISQTVDVPNLLVSALLPLDIFM